MPQLKLHSRRLYEPSDPITAISKLNRIAAEFEDNGWEVKRRIAGTVILTLADGEVHFIPTARGIEEIIFERRENNE